MRTAVAFAIVLATGLGLGPASGSSEPERLSPPSPHAVVGRAGVGGGSAGGRSTIAGGVSVGPEGFRPAPAGPPPLTPSRRERGEGDMVRLAAAGRSETVPSVVRYTETPPARVVSLNLCADQLLLALADRGQIASLSPLSRDEDYSFLAGLVDDLPVNGGTGEEILVGEADLVLSGRYGTRVKRELLERHGVELMVLDPWRDIAGGREQLRAVAARLGHPERGAALAAEIEAALARTRGIARRPATALVLYRRGYVPGERSLVGELLGHMGLQPMQARLGLTQGGLVRLEQLVMDPPDFVVMDEADARAIDNGTAFLVHPALARVLPPERRLFLSDRLTICGGPSTPAAIEALAAEVRAKVNGER